MNAWRVKGKKCIKKLNLNLNFFFCSYQEWICELTQLLSQKMATEEIFQLCDQLCGLRVDFAELIFPYLLVQKFFLIHFITIFFSWISYFQIVIPELFQ